MFSGFATRLIARTVALVLVASMLTGCAEINRRGGVVAEVEDYVLFTAHTKSHRLFRSYLLTGVLLAAARQGGHNDSDKASIRANLQTALEIAAEAYNCLYPGADAKLVLIGLTPATVKVDAAAIPAYSPLSYQSPVLCQFFDEKMARLDYALFRLALSTIFNAESNVYLSEIRDKLIGKIPVLSPAAKAALYANKAVNDATTIIDDLLNLSFSSAGPVVALLPLYRDSLELNMWLIVDNLTRFCNADVPPLSEPSYSLKTQAEACNTLAYAKYIMNDGNGDLRAWRNFVSTMNYAARSFEAYSPHYFLVTGLMWRTCVSLFGDDSKEGKCAGMLTKSLIKEDVLNGILYINGEGKRIYSAGVRSPTRVVRSPINTVPQSVAKPSIIESDPTGSIVQPIRPASRGQQ